MNRRGPIRSILRFLARGLLFLVAFLLLLVVVGLGALQTGWAKNLIRGVIVRQANQYLTAQLEIGRLGGSILRGVQLGDITLSRDGHPIVLIDDLSLTYSIRELFERGTVIRSIRLVRPRVFIARQPDGRWDIAALVKRESRESERTGPARPIHILSIEVMDGTVSLADPLDFGAAHVSTRFNSLNASLSFDYEPVKWRLMFANASWTGLAPDLTVSRLKGGLGRGPGGWTFDDLFVETPRTTFTLAGRANNDAKPTQLDLHVRAPRFAFQEWSGVLRGLKNIAVDASFETSLKGPLARLDTTLRLGGTGGSVTGALVLDTTVPGWHGSGALDVDRVNLARWLSRPNRPSDFSGRVTFDLALELGQHFPRGTYTFAGPHAAFMEYAADDVRARGQITSREVLIAGATAVAYGANVAVTSGSIGIDEPFPFRFAGTTTHTDLRRVPDSVPVPHVDSLLAFAYDVSGRFSQPFIAGRAEFARSEFLGATVGPGSVGTIDTSADPLTFGGTGEIDGVNVGRFGEGLGVAWMQEPRYAGTVSGRFNVEGAGTDRAQLTLTGGGRLARANLFGGSLSDADVTIDIDRGTLRASYNGRVQGIDPSIPLADPRFAATVSGSADVRTTVRDLLIRTPEVSDYDIDGSINVEASEVRGLHVDKGRIDGTVHDGIATLTRVDLTGPGIEGHGTGTLAFVDGQPSDFQYDITSADLAQLQPAIGDVTGLSVTGLVSTKGRLTGPWSAIRFAGDGSIGHLAAPRVEALTVNGSYDVTVPSWQIAHVTGRATGEASFLNVFGQAVQQAAGTLTLAEKRLGVDVQITQREGRAGALKGAGLVHDDGRGVDLAELTVTLGRAPWRLAPGDPPPAVAWSNEGLVVSPLLFLGGTAGDERIAVSGTVRSDGQGALRVTATHMFLDTIEGAFERPASYGGVVDFDATIRGTVEEPIVKARVTIAEGRVQRFSYQSLAGRVDYAGQMFDVDLRLDQSPGVWMNAAGTVPLAMFNRELAERPINLAVTSSSIGLGLIEGITSVVRNVTGELRVNATVVGTSRDPHFQGDVSLANAAFLVVSTGVRYKNGKAALTLATDRIGVDALHIEDSSGRPLDVHGSLGTHEMTVGDLEIDAEAKGFEIVRNEFGRMAVDLMLKLRGRLEMPRIGGTITIESGDLKVDEILTRTLFQPYSTEAISPTVVDAVVALNPWDRLGLDISLHVPTQMRLTGEDVQLSPDTPVGLGNISLRVGGDLYLYKDPGEPISVTGSLDRVAGTYTFQGRRFDINEASSSINFHGDLNPDVYVTVTRLISGVLTRVTIAGELNNPALQLASTPPLDESDILSLIVFNTSTNQLSSSQQQELALRGATLAAGFFATPLLSALENELGLDTLEIEPVGDFGTGPKVTVGEEIAPGLIARFSRQFGSDAYDEASIEYYLSRIIRLRATFSDASATSTRVAFYRVERSGVDLLFFFSF